MEQRTVKSNLKLYTSYVTPENLVYFSEREILPIFIIRNISNSNIIGKYSGTPIQFKELSPTTDLFQKLKFGEINFETYQKGYVIELAEINFSTIIKKLERLAEECSAVGIVLMGYEEDPSLCHRSLLADILNKSGLLVNPITEYNIIKEQ